MISRPGGKLSALLFVALFSVSIFGTATFAESGNVGGKPANPDPKNPRTSTIFIKTVEPGESSTDAVQVINNTESEKTIQIYSVDSVRSSGGAFACAQAADPIKDAGKWVALNESSVRLEAGQKKIVDFSVNVPKDAGPGEHNACIVIQEKADISVQSGVGLNFRTAIRVAVLVPGDIVKKIVPGGISAEVNSEKIDVSAKVKSESNVSLDTNVKVSLSRLIYADKETQNNTFPVLRGEEAEWNFEFDRPFWGGFYKASFSASYNADTTLSLGEGGGSNLTEVAGPSKTVFVWPQPAALAVELIVLALLLFILILIPKKIMGRHRIKKKWVERRVHAGETIAEIAEEVGVRWKKLAKVNKIKAPYNLVIGSSIRVPGSKVPVGEKSVDEEPEPYRPPAKTEVSMEVSDTVEETRAKDEPDMLKEPDSQETVDDIFEEDDIPQEEIAKEIATAKKIKVKKKPRSRSKPRTKK